MLPLFGRREDRKEERDELLSAYLDGELSSKERERLEARLAEDPALRAELRAMHRTVSLMRELPGVAAPRNFILSEAMVKRESPVREARPARPEARGRARAWAAPLLTAAATAVSLLFLVVLAGDLLLPSIGGFASAPAPMTQSEEVPKIVLEAAPTREPEVEAIGTAEAAPSPAVATAVAREESLEEPAEAPEMALEGELDAAQATRAAEAPPGMGGGTPPTTTAMLVLTSTIPAEAPVVSEEELGLVEPVTDELAVTPELAESPEFIREDQETGRQTPRSLPWLALEISLGLASVALGFAAFQAWRLRRR
jgi:hypothetical protein